MTFGCVVNPGYTAHFSYHFEEQPYVSTKQDEIHRLGYTEQHKKNNEYCKLVPEILSLALYIDVLLDQNLREKN